MTPTADPDCIRSPSKVPPQATDTIIRLPRPSYPQSQKVRQGRLIGKVTKKGAAKSYSDKVMEYVEVARLASDPEQALAESLLVDQMEQQARFAALPAAASQDGWIQLRHQQLLQANQASHDAALEILRRWKDVAATS